MGDVPDRSREETAERRAGSDRRRRPTPMLSRYTFIGRRCAPRRDIEGRSVYVDRPDRAAYVVLAVVLAMSLLDAVFTLIHLKRGGREANPLMDWAIGLGPASFLAIKIVLTSSGMVLLLLHRYFRGVRPLVGTILALYGGLMLYHLYLAVAW